MGGAQGRYANPVYVGIGPILVFDGHRMGAKEGGRDPDRAMLRDQTGRAQHGQLRFAIQPIAGLHLDGRNTLGEQRVHPRQRKGQQSLDIRFARRPHGRRDASAGARHVLVGGASQPHFELRRRSPHAPHGYDSRARPA